MDCLLKKAIHVSSKMEFLEHGKEKAIVKVENLGNLEQMIRNDGIQANSKSKTSTSDSNLRPRCEASGISKDLTRLRPHNQARKSEIRRVGRGRNGWDRRATVAHFEAYVNDMKNTRIAQDPEFVKDIHSPPVTNISPIIKILNNTSAVRENPYLTE
ncbi:hypothetical protein AVEN_249975-1 [Araneus ventricosus]|uniref:Uncharacterized protein n=1 Tax=Araneus ventricosus TaxID=182803 RepID=A0A4Y2HF17_ARAVE|nr:hypothetical protein AVEN_249975-1 [Araneus ventricosus]